MAWKLIWKGLIIESRCKYFYFHQGDVQRFSEEQDTCELVYKPQDTSYSLGSLLGLKTIGESLPLGQGMGRPEKYHETTISLNGIKFRKLTYDPHIVRIVIVGDNDSKVSQSYRNTTIVVGKDDWKNPDFSKFLLESGNFIYLEPLLGNIKPEEWEIRNFPKICIGNKSLDLKSDSETIYFLRKDYDKYLIRAIDYQDQFIREISRILEGYGIELTRMNREETLQRSSYISYNFSSTPVKYLHPRYLKDGDQIMAHRVPVDFIFRCSDTVMFHDFKNKYNNIDLLTNFCEFKATDRYGGRWTSAIKWAQISEDFNHLYQGDDNSNYSHQCSFRCELYFYEVYDTSTKFLKDVKIEIG